MRRPASDADLERVFAIYMHPTVVPFLGYDPMPLADFRPIYEALLRSGEFFVVEDEGEVVGFYRVTRHPGRARHGALLATLAVSPAAQGRGVARRMVEDAIAHLRADGVTRVELSVESDNPRAIAFYQRLGFEREGVLRRAYRRAGEAHPVDEILMARLFD